MIIYIWYFESPFHMETAQKHTRIGMMNPVEWAASPAKTGTVAATAKKMSDCGVIGAVEIRWKQRKILGRCKGSAPFRSIWCNYHPFYDMLVILCYILHFLKHIIWFHMFQNPLDLGELVSWFVPGTSGATGSLKQQCPRFTVVHVELAR